MSNDIAVIEQNVWALREPFMAALTEPAINFDAEAGFALQLLRRSEFALNTAMRNQQSLYNAITNIAAVGITLDPVKKLAYLVPRDGQICLDISYTGLLDIAVKSRCIRWGQSRLVYASDFFELNGIDQQPTHRCKPFEPEELRGDVVGVYCVVKTLDGDFLTETMSMEQVFNVRDRSSAWRAWVEKKRSCPWVTDEDEMTRKTVIKRAYKYWPKSDRMDRAIDMLNRQNEEGLAGLDDPDGNGADDPGGAEYEPRRRSMPPPAPRSPDQPPPPPASRSAKKSAKTATAAPPAATRPAATRPAAAKKASSKPASEDANVVGESKTIDKGRLAHLRRKIESIGMDDDMVAAMCARLKVPGIDERMTIAQFADVNAELSKARNA